MKRFALATGVLLAVLSAAAPASAMPLGLRTTMWAIAAAQRGGGGDLPPEPPAPDTFAVTFDANGGDGTMAPQTFTNGVVQALSSNEFAKTDFAFAGWATNAAGPVVYSDGQSIAITTDVTLYAQWTDAGVTPPYGTPIFTIEDGVLTAVDLNGATDVAIPESATNVANGVFRWCHELRSVFVPASVTYIARHAFYGCTALKEIVFEEGSASLTLNCPFANTALTELHLPARWNGFRSVNPFADCSTLTNVTVSSGNAAFAVVNGVLLSADGKTVYGALGGLSVIEVPEGVETIAYRSLCGLPNAEEIVFPDSVRELKSQSFYGCPSLKTIRFGNGVVILRSLEEDDTLIWGCEKLEAVYFAGNAPTNDTQYIYRWTPEDMVTYVTRDSTGWGVDIPGMWNGRRIEHVEQAPPEPEPWDPATIRIDTEAEYKTDDDGTFELDLVGLIRSAAVPTVTVKGLPTGLKYDAKKGVIGGKATKPGVYAVTVSAKSKIVTKPVTATFTLTVPNFTSDTFKDAGLDTDGKYVLGAGAAPDLSGVIQNIKAGGWKLAAAGLPAGLKYDDKNSAITGVATKEGVFTVTFTATQGKTKEIATATYEVVFPTLALDIAAYGEDASATNKAKVVGGGKYPVGAKVTLKATPDKGKVFAGWFDGEGKPLAGAADYRTASFPYVATDADEALTAKFATEAEDIDSLKVNVTNAATATDGTYELDLGACVESASLPKLAVKGLPMGLKFDAKTLKITGKATKPGVYPVKVEATNTSVKKATDASTGEFELKVPNFTTDTFKAAGLDTDGKYVLAAGVLPGDITNVVNAVVAGGWALKIDGLPAGVKYDAKKNVFTGVATKEGFFTVTFTATKGKDKEVATATFEVAYPTLTLEIAAYDDETATNKCKVAGGGNYAVGAKVTLKATPDKGKVFAGWFDGEGKPLAGAADYRTASFPYVATDADEALTAKFATEAEDIDSLKVNVTNAATATDGTYELGLGACVESASLPKLAVKGLPTGLKFDAKTLKITGNATKPGVYPVKVEATNTSVKKATAASTGEFKLTVPNFTCAALPKLKAETDAYGTNFAGVAFDPALVDCTPAEEGWTVKVAGLPAGLKYDAKTGKIAGVSTAKPGAYTVTFTATKGKEKQEATITLNVDALPDWAVGSFDGATVDGAPVTLTVAANGKVSMKTTLADGKSLSLAAASFDTADDGVFYATAVGKNGKEVVTNEVTVASFDIDGVDVGKASGDEWTAWQNLWKRADTKGGMPVFKASFDRTVELGEKNSVKLTFKKDGVVSFAGKVGGAKVSGSSQLVNDGTGWSVTLYAPPKAPFDGWSKTFDVALTTDEKNVVTDVTVGAAAAVAPVCAVGEYIGYGNVYKPNKTGLDEYLYGMLYVDVAEDLTFTGRFEPVDRSGSCPFSGKFTPFGGGGAPGYQADRVTITVKGVHMSIGFSMIYKPYADKEQGYGEIFGWSNYVSEDEERFCPTRVWQNVWKQENLAEERPTFAEGTVLTIEPQYEAGDSLNFAFSADGKSVAVTGQVDGKVVDTTATIGVETQSEGKCECYLYFMSGDHIYSLTFTIPSSGVVSGGDITLEGAWNTYFGMINAW